MFEAKRNLHNGYDLWVFNRSTCSYILLRCFNGISPENNELHSRLRNRDQQWIAFSLLVSSHEILSMIESTALKSNYSDSFVLKSTLIYKYRLQWVWVKRWHQTHYISNMFDLYVYSFRFIHLEKYL